MTSPISSAAAGSRLILAVSFSGPGGSLALADDLARTRGVIDEIAWEKRATASELATVKLEELMSRNELRVNRITRVLVNVGPGSFTGIRVGVNLARTLAYALDVPVAGLDALTILAHRNLRAGDTRLIALKAVREYYYAAAFTRTPTALVTTLTPRSISRPDPRLDATEVLIEGETKDFDPHPSAGDLLRVGLECPDLVPYSSWNDVKPLYIRGSEAEEKLRK